MDTPKPPLTPQMQEALQRGDIRALMQALRAQGSAVDLQAARQALARQVREAQQHGGAGALQVPPVARGAVEAAREAKQDAAHALRQRRRPSTVEMGDRPGEMRWMLLVAALLALAVWVVFGGP